MYRLLACTLAMERLYGTYISSSSGHGSSILAVSLTVPTQHYEGLLCDCCQTETLHYVTSDNASRPEKLEALADDKDVQKYVAVCYDAGPHGENCGECYACMKTMIPLDIMGKLDRFGESFDLEKYNAEREAKSINCYMKHPFGQPSIRRTGITEKGWNVLTEGLRDP